MKRTHSKEAKKTAAHKAIEQALVDVAKDLGVDIEELQNTSIKSTIMRALLDIMARKLSAKWPQGLTQFLTAPVEEQAAPMGATGEEIMNQINLRFNGQVPMSTITRNTNDMLPELIREGLVIIEGTTKDGAEQYILTPEGTIIADTHAQAFDREGLENS